MRLRQAWKIMKTCEIGGSLHSYGVFRRRLAIPKGRYKRAFARCWRYWHKYGKVEPLCEYVKPEKSSAHLQDTLVMDVYGLPPES